MIEVIESKIATQNGYRKNYINDDNNEIEYSSNVLISSACIQYEGFEYILLFDNNGNVIRDAYRYLNHERKDQSINTRLRTASTLRVLYSFLELYACNLTKLDNKAISQLKEFLLGGTRKGIEYRFINLTRRNNETVNSCLTLYRNYLEFLGINNKVLTKTRNVNVESIDPVGLGQTTYNSYKKYVVNLNTAARKQTVPMYIKEDEFEKIIDVIKTSKKYNKKTKKIEKKYGIREEILVRLMFENGLRIGEALGLTLEDIGEDRIYIRNRLSDKAYQKAKTAMQVNNKDDYKVDGYNDYRYGYFIIRPKRRTLSKINRYLQEVSLPYLSEKSKVNYLKNAKADTVGDGSNLEGDNYYIFLNSQASPLTFNGWNKILREIFEEVGLIVDKETREHNLNHRFRHGFAMKLRKEGKSALEIKDALKNHSIGSVSCYFRPTEEDMYDANEYGTEVSEEYAEIDFEEEFDDVFN